MQSVLWILTPVPCTLSPTYWEEWRHWELSACTSTFLQKFSGLFLWLFQLTPNPFSVATFSLRISTVVEQKGSSKCSQQSWKQEHNLSIFWYWNPFLQCDMATLFTVCELIIWGDTNLWQTGTDEHIDLWLYGYLIIEQSLNSFIENCWYWSDTFSRDFMTFLKCSHWSVWTQLPV